jgi:hypothetical protein
MQRIPCRSLLLDNETLLAVAGAHERLVKKVFIFIIRDDCIIFSAYNKFELTTGAPTTPMLVSLILKLIIAVVSVGPLYALLAS